MPYRKLGGSEGLLSHYRETLLLFAATPGAQEIVFHQIAFLRISNIINCLLPASIFQQSSIFWDKKTKIWGGR